MGRTPHWDSEEHPISLFDWLAYAEPTRSGPLPCLSTGQMPGGLRLRRIRTRRSPRSIRSGIRRRVAEHTARVDRDAFGAVSGAQELDHTFVRVELDVLALEDRLAA